LKPIPWGRRAALFGEGVDERTGGLNPPPPTIQTLHKIGLDVKLTTG
jgi:hypothetical protein